MINKTDKVKELLINGLEDEALRIGKTFRKGNKELIDNIQRGYDASRNPKFYIQLKMDPEELYNKAINSLKQLVGIDILY